MRPPTIHCRSRHCRRLANRELCATTSKGCPHRVAYGSSGRQASRHMWRRFAQALPILVMLMAATSKLHFATAMTMSRAYRS